MFCLAEALAGCIKTLSLLSFPSVSHSTPPPTKLLKIVTATSQPTATLELAVFPVALTKHLRRSDLKEKLFGSQVPGFSVFSAPHI